MHYDLSFRNTGWLVLAVIAASTVALPATATAQDWLTRHGNSAHNGVTSIAGDIDSPAVKFRRNIDTASAGSFAIEDVTGDGVPEYVTVSGGALTARSLITNNLLWDTGALGAADIVEVGSFTGSGNPELLVDGDIMYVIDGPTGQVVWSVGPPTGLFWRGVAFLTAANVDGDAETEILINERDVFRVYDLSAGPTDVPVYESNDAAFDINIVRPVVGDLDGDGDVDPEIAMITRDCVIAIVDLTAAPGSELTLTAPTVGGSFCYGTTQVANVDGDPQEELIWTGTIGSGNGSVVLGVYDHVDGSVQWAYEYATDSTTSTTFGPRELVTDLDDDGNLEIVVSVLDNQAEVGGMDDGLSYAGGWVLVVYDAASGAVIDSVQDKLFIGAADLDGDGVDEVLTRAAETDGSVPIAGDVEVWELDGSDNLVATWTIPNSTPAVWAPRVTDDTAVYAIAGVPPVVDLDGNGNKLLLARGDDTDNTVDLEVIDLQGGGAFATVQSTQLSGSNSVVLLDNGTGVLANGERHAVITDSLGSATLRDSNLVSLGPLTQTGAVSYTFVGSLANGSRHIVYRNGSDEVVALDVDGADSLTPPTVFWRAPDATEDFMMLDIDDDGLHEVVVSGTNSSGEFFLELRDSDGAVAWSVVYPTVNRAPFELVYGAFEDDGGIDIAYFAREPGTVKYIRTVDGATGNLLDERDDSTVSGDSYYDLHNRGDVNGDNIDDLLVLHFRWIEQIDGSDLSGGTDFRFLNAARRPFNTSLVTSDLDTEVAFMKSLRETTAMIDVEPLGERWSIPTDVDLTNFVNGYAGFSDVDGDGTYDVAVPGNLSQFSVYDGTDGTALYRICLDRGNISMLAAPATQDTCSLIGEVSNIASADIDGDGDDDFIVGDSSGYLYAVDAATGALVWSTFVGGSVFAPAVADTDGDGTAEVIVTTTRSQVVVIDQAEINPVAEVRDVASDSVGVVDPGTDIDEWDVQTRLGAAWEAAVGADRYTVELVTSNNTPVVGITPVGNVTEHVFRNLALVPGTTYRTKVVAINDTLGAAPVVTSNGVLIVGAAPTVGSVAMDPNTLVVGVGDTAEITAEAQADGVIRLDTIVIYIYPSGGTSADAVRTETLDVDETEVDVSFTWDATDDSGSDVAAGAYVVEVCATDELGEETCDTADVSVRDPGAPSISQTSATPMTFSPYANPSQTTTIEASFAADEGAGAVLESVTVICTSPDAPGVQREFNVTNIGSATSSVSFVWEGDDDDGTVVPPGTYTCDIVVTDSLGLSTEGSITGIVVLGPNDPVLVVFEAEPNSIDATVPETTTITMELASEVRITDVDLAIVSREDDTVVHTRSYAVGQTTTTLFADWNGRDDDGQPVPAGLYDAQLTVSDERGNPPIVYDMLLDDPDYIEIVPPPNGTVTVDNPAVNPDPFDNCAGQNTIFSADIATDAGRVIEEVTVSVREIGAPNPLFQTTETFDQPALGWTYIWDGRDNTGELVPPGTYSVIIDATNDGGVLFSETTMVTITCTDTGDPEPDVGTPDTGTPDAGMDMGTEDEEMSGNVQGGSSDGCGCTTPSAPAGPKPLWLVAALVVLGGLVVRMRR